MERVSLGQRVMIKELQQHPELNGQLGTVVQAVGMACTKAESARVAVSYTCATVTSVPALAAGTEGTGQMNAEYCRKSRCRVLTQSR